MIGTASAIARMVGIITSPLAPTSVSNASPPIMPKIKEKEDENDDDDEEKEGIDLESPEFNHPVVVRGTDLPAGMLLFRNLNTFYL